MAQGCVYASQQGWRDVEPLPWTGAGAKQLQSLMTKSWKGKRKYSGLNPDRFVHAASREKKKEREREERKFESAEFKELLVTTDT